MLPSSATLFKDHQIYIYWKVIFMSLRKYSFCKSSVKLWSSIKNKGFRGGSDSKGSACNTRDPGLMSWSGRSLGEENDNPLQYSCLGHSMDRGAWWLTVQGVTRVGHDLVAKPLHGCYFLKSVFFLWRGEINLLTCSIFQKNNQKY